jgi:PPOX class probable F420-dependent enzyme
MSPRIATTTPVSRSELIEFLTPRHRMILTTHRGTGGLQQSPVTAGVDAAGRVVIASYPERAKVHNLRRDPRAGLLVLSEDWDGPWVQVDGTADILDLPEALEPLVDYFRAIAGEHSDWEDYRAAMQRQGKCLIRITAERWGPIATGGFPPRLG